MSVVYIPPPSNEIERYARQVCRGWAEQYGAEYGEMGFVSGVVGLMKLSVAIHAKYLNKGVENHEQEKTPSGD